MARWWYPSALASASTWRRAPCSGSAPDRSIAGTAVAPFDLDQYERSTGMTKLSVILTTAAVLALPFAPAAFAADEKKPAADDKRPARSTAATDKDALRSHPGGLIEAKWLVGSPVRNADGQDMGKIEEVWLDPKSGQVKEAVISVGGF